MECKLNELEKLTEFMKGLVAANQLMNRAAATGCFVEFICLATSIIDGSLRIGLILQYQLDANNCDIRIELVYQAESGRGLSERSIYTHALENKILTQEQFDLLKRLYKKRNKVVHRYVISC
jgi:uncharacterized protein YutE (UPF0331/DUF86 family)